MKRLDIVGFGPGSLEGMTLEAMEALEASDLIVGFKTYVSIVKQFLPGKNYYENGMGDEEARVIKALDEALTGKRVSLICSGDSTLYGMSSLAFELKSRDSRYTEIELRVIPGVSAAFSAGALVGAAINSDMATISLSDYHISLEDIMKKVRYACMGDYVIAIYNPASHARKDYLKKACETAMGVIPGDRPCAAAYRIGREGQGFAIMTLSELKDYEADMFTTIIIGSSRSEIIDGRMVTKR